LDLLEDQPASRVRNRSPQASVAHFSGDRPRQCVRVLSDTRSHGRPSGRGKIPVNHQINHVSHGYMYIHTVQASDAIPPLTEVRGFSCGRLYESPIQPGSPKWVKVPWPAPELGSRLTMAGDRSSRRSVPRPPPFTGVVVAQNHERRAAPAGPTSCRCAASRPGAARRCRSCAVPTMRARDSRVRSRW